MKPAGVKSSTYIEFRVEKKDEDAIFEVGYCVRISNIKCILQNVIFQVGLTKILYRGHME